ncbi:monoamine oxidase [Pseudomonas marginalis]|jgi:monoamine oxidase|uniref:flavin monoamine oxidase family protein n=1 Tax=Pseudomonas TaxID=286 RepID=UPI0020A1A9BF|nr:MULTISPECIES: NAD(P)/FAD-dependent oxidoreductase [Pseudomonas]MCP1507718.1 monoamine oxidase [Pseudomonas marginalis]MCP1525222.1 monoamine oxidase [Pseudomonas marginalis]MDQ0500183.1 monoamine oxidase [Pseudomonas marginalis]
MTDNDNDLLKATYNRRQTLKGIAAGATTVLAASVLNSAMASSIKPAPDVPEKTSADGGYDTIIIGGGMAGATAARELGTRGKKCLVLEARNRTGGRTFTTEVFGERADVGGQWIHWIQPHVWAEMQRYGLQLLETPGASPTAYGVVVNGKLEPFDPAKAFELLNLGMQVFSKDVIDLFPRPYDPNFNPDSLKTDNISIAQRMKQINVSDETRAILESYFTTAVNGPIEQAGYLDQIHWYARAGNDMDRLLRACTQYKISTGTSSLIELLFRDSRAEVKLNTPVQKVEQSSRGVKVTAENGKTYFAKSCIVALPMNCWNDIEWLPALSPGKVAASKERHVGSGFELKVKVKGNKGSYQGMASSGYPINLVYTDYISDHHTKFVAMGYSVPGFDVNDDDNVREAFTRLLPGAEIMESFAYDWNSDPYSKGTWCDYKPGMWSKYGEDMRKDEGRVVFAGSDIANGWRGFIDGAIETGLRASRIVLKQLG